MKRRTRAPFAAAVSIAAVLFACVLIFLIMKTYSLAADEDEVALAIDYMDDAEAWTADDENVYVLSRGYTLSTSGSKGGDDDNGYLFVRVNSVPEDGAFHIIRTFDEPLNLYSYSDIALMCSLVEGSEACEYTVAVTLLSDSASNPTFTSSAFLTPDGEWHTLSFSLDGWAGRGDIVGIEIELSIVVLDGYSAEGESLTLRLDALTATGTADTSVEEKFTASAFYADGAALTYSGDAFLWNAYDGGSVSWSPIFESEDSLDGHD
ncbi:MAG: hypothetical protein LUH54_00765, partial [Firmicutes bacterium]|nr:hypothetical protein [Bacillota bacterium]